MRRVFIDSALEQDFLNQGYVCVDFFSTEELYAVKTLFNKHSNQLETPFHSSHFSKDRSYKKEVHAGIVDQGRKKIGQLLMDYKPLFANFMVKKSGADTVMPLHADWTYVKEPDFCSVACWIPLVDTGPENGSLGVIPGSHALQTNLRGPRIPSPFHHTNSYLIETYGKILSLKAGQAVIYDHRLLHFSPPNLSPTIRPALNMVLVPAEAQLFHYLCEEGQTTAVLEYPVKDESFFLEYDHYEIPDQNQVVKQLYQEINPFSKAYLDSVLGVKKSKWASLLARLGIG
ncbi:MAG: phytanoyl-CoA dioxygenase family protein [Bacteroidia bacterium]|nr:phytanoyl-CoA dioxygenase family protein [Bacteroidia bacterium]